MVSSDFARKREIQFSMAVKLLIADSDGAYEFFKQRELLRQQLGLQGDFDKLPPLAGNLPPP